MINVSASDYAIAAKFASQEETRYYLNGVYIEPCPRGGVLLVATNGHSMIVINDESGSCDKPEIIRLDKQGLAICRQKNSARLQLDDARKAVVGGVYSPTDSVVIDGTFPDWRKVVEPVRKYIADGKPQAPASFNGRYVADFCAAATALSPDDGTASIRMITGPAGSSGETAGDPMLVLFPKTDRAFGMLMPMRTSDVRAIPLFMKPLAKAATKAKRKAHKKPSRKAA